jgi:tRNA threonylcarbamoyladenosine biosynthesis protein TsaB
VIILALDSTSRAGSVAVWRDGELEERVGNPARTHAERLPGDILTLLEAHGVSLGEVDRYAVVSGPGSFTGLRVGIATIQALALVHDRKVVAVSSLELLAQSAARQHALPPGHLVGGWMEAYRGEVFAALYRTGDAVRGPACAGRTPLRVLTPMTGPAVGAPDRVSADWKELSGGAPIVIAGDAVPSTRATLESRFGETLIAQEPLPLTGALAGVLADWAATWPEEAVLPHAIVPQYVRRPDAELARARQ